MLEKILLMLGEAAAMNEELIVSVHYSKEETSFTLIDINGNKYIVRVEKSHG